MPIFSETCTFDNDTNYEVVIEDYDGNYNLHPGRKQGNYLLKGPYEYYVNLVMKFPDGDKITKKFHRSKYKGMTHYMSVIFHDDIQRRKQVEYKKELEARRRRMEKRDEQVRIEEQKRMREKEQRDSEKRRKDLEELKHNQEEARKEHERQEALRREEQERAKKRQEQQRLAKERRKVRAQLEFEDQLSNEGGLGKSFFSWVLDNEREKVQQEVNIQTYHPFSYSMIEPSHLISDNQELLLSDDAWSEDEEENADNYGIGSYNDSTEIREIIVSMVSDVQPSNQYLDIEWLQAAQTRMLCSYAQRSRFSLSEEGQLFNFLASIRSNLSNKEHLYLTKTICEVCTFEGYYTSEQSGVPSAFTTTRSANFLSMLLCCANELGYTDTDWMDKCLNTLVLAAKVPDRQLQNMIMESFSKFWSPYFRLCFLHKCSEKQIPAADQKKILHLIQTYDLPYYTVKAAFINDCSGIIQNLTEFVQDEPDQKPLANILTEIRQTKLIEPEMLEVVEKIMSQVYHAVLDPNFLIKYNYDKYLTNESLSQVRSILKERKLDIDELATVIATLACAVQKFKGYCPRYTQLVALTILILSDHKSTSRLLQVLTGEGKSCIIAMFAAMLSIQDKYVDIITSSPILASRDADEWKAFYEIFGLTATHNITDLRQVQAGNTLDADKEQQKCYEHHIVYGTVSNFAADVLREEFEQKQVRSGKNWCRRFDAVIADEVDLLTLDEGVQFTYLSHNAAVLHHIEPVLASVWCTIGQYRLVSTVRGNLFFANFLQKLYLSA